MLVVIVDGVRMEVYFLGLSLREKYYNNAYF